MPLWTKISKLFHKMVGKRKFFDAKQLCEHIRLGRNDEAKAMLNKDTINSKYPEFGGILLHYAAVNNNMVIVQYLIDLGADIDHFDEYGKTPLVNAVLCGCVVGVDVLLKANANIHAVGANHLSALQLVFDLEYSNTAIFQLIFSKLLNESIDTEDLVDKLKNAGCTLYRASCLRDFEVVKCMLRRGFDANSTGPDRKTALHVAAMSNEARMAKLLIDHGADVNARDNTGHSPLLFAVSWGGKDTVRYLLEAGADPNDTGSHSGLTPLLSVFINVGGLSSEETDECLELLFQHGAIPRSSSNYPTTLFDLVWSDDKSDKCSMLVNHLAMLMELGKPIDDSVFHCSREIVRSKMPKMVNLCRYILRHVFFGNSSMFDLLTDSESKMRIRVRNSHLMSTLQLFLSENENKRLFPYFCNALVRRISKARRVVELEDKVIPVVCQIMNGNHNQCYIVTRILVSYLNEEDLEQLACL